MSRRKRGRTQKVDDMTDIDNPDVYDPVVSPSPMASLPAQMSPAQQAAHIAQMAQLSQIAAQAAAAQKAKLSQVKTMPTAPMPQNQQVKAPQMRQPAASMPQVQQGNPAPQVTAMPQAQQNKTTQMRQQAAPLPQMQQGTLASTQPGRASNNIATNGQNNQYNNQVSSGNQSGHHNQGNQQQREMNGKNNVNHSANNSHNNHQSGNANNAGVRRMLMNVVDPEQVRVAIVDEAGLAELYIDRASSVVAHGNIYKGKVQNIEPGLQAAFIDIGMGKNGFLHANDVLPPSGGYEDILKKRKRKMPKDPKRIPIENMLYKGQELLVQITREAIDQKGPALTTYISIPGRYLVFMPAVSKRGVSKKITDENERRELRRALDELDPPGDFGFIIRTAGMGRGRQNLRGDLDYLMRLWDAISERVKKVKAPCPIYMESDLTIRAVRDYLYEDVQEVWIDGLTEYQRLQAFLSSVMPQFVNRTLLYQNTDPIFHHFGVESWVERIFSRSVPLPSGGEIVIEQTEAMVAIDVNTKRFKIEDSREMVLQINREAAIEIARQLRLRDLGGLIMLDFVDMDAQSDRREIEDLLRRETSRDRARTSILGISPLGVLEMTRQRVRKSVENNLFCPCPVCQGSGILKSSDIVAIDFLRDVRTLLETSDSDVIAVMHPDTALAISNSKRAALAKLEQEKERRIFINADPDMRRDVYRLNISHEKYND